MLHQVVASMMSIVEAYKARAASDEVEQRARQEVERQREQERFAAERRRALEQRLHDHAEAFAATRRPRVYIRAIRRAAAKHGWHTTPGTRLGDWLVWAEQQTDAGDPVKAWVIKSMGVDGPRGA